MDKKQRDRYGYTDKREYEQQEGQKVKISHSYRVVKNLLQIDSRSGTVSSN